MKRKTYEKKMRNFLHQLNQTLPAEQRFRDMRVHRPDFDYVPKTGKNAGRPYESYQQVWDDIVDGFKGSSIADKL